MNRKILVTGGVGYIGDSVVEYLQKISGVQVSVLDDLVYGGSYMRDVEFIRADVTDIKKMIEVLDREWYAVVHLAALVGDGACAVNELKTATVNTTAVRDIAALCNERGIRLVFASTCSVYGKNDSVLDEASETIPLSVYAHSKLAAEKEIEKYCPNHVIFRLGTLFGMSTPHARIRCDLVANILTYRASRGETLDVHGGEQWRPLLHVKDAAMAFARAAIGDRESNFLTGTYVLSHKNYTITELAKEIVGLVGGKVNFSEKLYEDMRNYKVDSSKIKKLMFFPQRTVREGVLEMSRVLKEGRIADIWAEEYHNAKYIKAHHG